jgi:hypothetical protein
MNLQQIKELSAKQPIDFFQVMDFIDAHYSFSETAFQNGDLKNEAGQNNGSCKVFAFGQKHELSEQQTLHLFGDFYKKDVLENPENEDHQNIRNFMKYGWRGIQFTGSALTIKDLSI